jgi:hypothetical protein
VLIIVLLCALAPVALVTWGLPLWGAAILFRLPRRGYGWAWLANALGVVAGWVVTALIGAPLAGLLPVVGLVLAFVAKSAVELLPIMWLCRSRFWPAAGAWLVSSLVDWAITGLMLLAFGGSLVAFLAEHGVHLPAFIR